MNPEGGATALGLTIPLVILIVSVILLLTAIRRVLRVTDGTNQVLWLAFVVLTNPIGPIVALFALPSEGE